MIKLYQFAPATYWQLPNASPFCMKVETYLKMAKLPYEIVSITDPRVAPKGKLPFIEDNGKIISDSAFILEYLKTTYGDSVDGQLSKQEQSESLILQKMMEEHLVWVLIYNRWMDPEGWRVVKNNYFKAIPKLLKGIIIPQIRKKMLKSLNLQGMGRHSRDEIYRIGAKAIDALSARLDTQDFFFGKIPSSVDAVAHAILSNILKTPINTPLQRHARSNVRLNAYCQRMDALYY